MDDSFNLWEYLSYIGVLIVASLLLSAAVFFITGFVITHWQVAVITFVMIAVVAFLGE